jgi:hypothetical protein
MQESYSHHGYVTADIKGISDRLMEFTKALRPKESRYVLTPDGWQRLIHLSAGDVSIRGTGARYLLGPGE